MLIQIKENLKISEIQEQFSSIFPFLKLEFIKNKTHARTSVIKQPLIDINKTLYEIRTILKDSFITISPTMTVSELENQFIDIFGLSTQVFRKSGNIWLVTTVTDKWTLEEQNRQGEIITNQVNERKSQLNQL